MDTWAKKAKSWHNCSYRRFNCFHSWFYQTARLFRSDVIAQTCYTAGRQQQLRSIQGNKRSFCSQWEDGSDKMERFSNVGTPYQEIRCHCQLTHYLPTSQRKTTTVIPQIQLWPTLSRDPLLGQSWPKIQISSEPKQIFASWTLMFVNSS